MRRHARSRAEVLRFRMVDDESIGRLLGMKLQLLGQGDADPVGSQQLDDFRSVFKVGAGGITEGVARSAIRLVLKHRLDVGAGPGPRPGGGGCAARVNAVSSARMDVPTFTFSITKARPAPTSARSFQRVFEADCSISSQPLTAFCTGLNFVRLQ